MEKVKTMKMVTNQSQYNSQGENINCQAARHLQRVKSCKIMRCIIDSRSSRLTGMQARSETRNSSCSSIRVAQRSLAAWPEIINCTSYASKGSRCNSAEPQVSASSISDRCTMSKHLSLIARAVNPQESLLQLPINLYQSQVAAVSFFEYII